MERGAEATFLAPVKVVRPAIKLLRAVEVADGDPALGLEKALETQVVGQVRLEKFLAETGAMVNQSEHQVASRLIGP